MLIQVVSGFGQGNCHRQRRQAAEIHSETETKIPGPRRGECHAQQVTHRQASRGKPCHATAPPHLVSSRVGEENLRVGSETIPRLPEPLGNQSPWGTDMLPSPTRSSLLGAQVRGVKGRGLCQLATPPCKCQGGPKEAPGSAQDVMPASTACGHRQGSDQKRSQFRLSQHLTAPLSQTGN